MLLPIVLCSLIKLTWVLGTLVHCRLLALQFGTLFNLSKSLDEYDLIIALDDDIQSLILCSLPVDGYEHKCRLLSEFISVDFCNVNDNINNDESEKLHEEKIISSMLEPELWERVEPFYNELILVPVQLNLRIYTNQE